MQYGRTMHARAAAEARKHMAGDVDRDSRRVVGPIRRVIYDTTKPSAAFGGTFSP
jgi:hypothetical protein